MGQVYHRKLSDAEVNKANPPQPFTPPADELPQKWAFEYLPVPVQRVVTALVLALFACVFFGLPYLFQQSSRPVQEAKLGMSQTEIQTLLGEPDRVQEMNSIYGKSAYWYYGNTQICFDGSRVTSINKY